jgi:cobalt-zinc-cadmium efflux system protein
VTENHNHEHDNKHLINRLSWAFVLTLVIFIAELVGGFLSNSLALLSDAGHLFADVFAIGLSLAALYISRLPATHKKTFGYHRAEVFAAFINGISLVIIAIVIFTEAYHRLQNPEPVKTTAMLIVAIIGLVANVVIALRLHHSAAHSLNVKSAYLHVLGDMLASVGVIIGGLVMYFTGNYLADPIISVVVGLIILKGAYGVVKEALDILLEGVPAKIDYEKLKDDILDTPDVIKVHDLHVWTLSSQNIMLTMHVVLDGKTTHAGRKVLENLQNMLADKHDIKHSTIQLECECFDCPQETECLVNERGDGHQENQL